MAARKAAKKAAKKVQAKKSAKGGAAKASAAKAGARKLAAKVKGVVKRKAAPIPKGFTTVTPHLVVNGAAEAIELYKKAFGAKEKNRMPGPDGRLMHAEIQIGDARLMLSDEFPGGSSKSPKALGGTHSSVMLYVKKVDAVFEQAVKAGFTVTMPVADMFWGDRYGQLVDPFGHSWAIATHIEDVTPKQMAKRMAAQAPAA